MTQNQSGHHAVHFKQHRNGGSLSPISSAQLGNNGMNHPVETQWNCHLFCQYFRKKKTNTIQNWWIIYYLFVGQIPFHQPQNTTVFVAVWICLRESNKSQVTWCFSCLATEVIEALGDPLGSLGESFWREKGGIQTSCVIIQPTQTMHCYKGNPSKLP